jgi:hypothetical protein
MNGVRGSLGWLPTMRLLARQNFWIAITWERSRFRVRDNMSAWFFTRRFIQHSMMSS